MGQAFSSVRRGGSIEPQFTPSLAAFPTPLEQIDAVIGLGRQRCAGWRIAIYTGRSRFTVSHILRLHKFNRMPDLEPLPVYPRYEHEAQGDMLHLDIKKLGRFT